MGRRGPAPTPTALRILKGQTKPSLINRQEPVPPAVHPVKPGWLSGYAAEEWDRVLPDLIAMHLAARVDSTSLAAYCEAVARLRAAMEVLASVGLVVRGPDGELRKNPVASQARDASADVRAWAREFGLTPAARQPLRAGGPAAGLPAERLLS